VNLFSIVIFAQTNFLFVPCECRSSAYGLRTSKDEALFDWLFVEEDNKKMLPREVLRRRNLGCNLVFSQGPKRIVQLMLMQ